MNYPSTSNAQQTDRRSRLLTRWSQLKTERASWMAHWQEISTYLLPRSGRQFTQDRNKGTKKHNNIYDNTATRALRVLGSGLMAGATSPARPWFQLTTPDPDLNKFHTVRVWLSTVRSRMMGIFQRSNTYRTLHTMYEELGAFGTAATLVMPEADRVLHHYPLTCGEYAISTDNQGKVCTLYREFDMTVSQMVKEFGRDMCSQAVRNMYDRGNVDEWVTVIHSVEPREDRDPSKVDALNMPWKSCYFEVGGESEKYLRESGFAHFPALVPRWAVRSGDIYGHSPGMECLGDIKQLQHEQLRKAQAIDYQTKPPLQVPTSMKNRDIETLPGGISFVDATSPQGGIRTAFEVNLNLNYLLQDLADIRQRIDSTFYADLFLMLASSNNGRMTATEVAERHEEKLLMLGPVLERLHNELLDPLIELTFVYMMDAGMVPPPPPELAGMELNVEFVSMLAQAQRAMDTNGIDRLLMTVGTMSQMRPDVLDKLDTDLIVDRYSQMLGVDPSMIVSSEKVMSLRQARDQAMAAKEQAAMMPQMAQAAKNISAIPTSPSASNDVIGMFSGYNSPQPQMF